MKRTLLHRMFGRRPDHDNTPPSVVWAEVLVAALIVAVLILESVKP